MKLGKKTIVLLGVPLGLGLAGGLAAFVMLSGPSVPPEVPDPDPALGQHGVMLPLDEKVINLMQGGDYRYAKVGVTLEVRPPTADFYALKAEARVTAEEGLAKEYESELPLLLDALGRVVGSKTSTELGTPDGRSGLKTELLEAMRGVMGEEEVLDLYFTDMVMQ